MTSAIENADEEDPDGGLLRLALAPGGSIDDYRVSCLPDELEGVAAALLNRASVRYSRELAAPIRAGEVLGSISIPSEDGGELTGTLIARPRCGRAQAGRPLLRRDQWIRAPVHRNLPRRKQPPKMWSARPQALQAAAAPQAGATVLSHSAVAPGPLRGDDPADHRAAHPAFSFAADGGGK